MSNVNEIMEIKFNHKFFRDEGFCELTDEMDKYLLNRENRDIFHTYISYFGKREDGKDIYVMRVPGATRGCMIIDKNNIIETIKFYEDTCYDLLHCYDRKMEEIKEKYIGREIVIIRE